MAQIALMEKKKGGKGSQNMPTLIMGEMTRGRQWAGPDPSQRSSIRAVERAIDLLQSLNRRPISTLHDLHQDTGLPKPSLVRLLRTLETKGLVTHSSTYGAYQLLATVKSLSSGFHNEPLIVEIAEEAMIEFTRREGWPLALALFDRDAMVVRSSTIPYTSLSLFHSSINMRLGMISRAMGRAYLAHCSPNVQKIILEIVKRTGNPEDSAAKNTEAVTQMLRQVREQGYSLRNPVIEPRTSTLSVPVMDGQRVVACLGLTWITAAMPTATAIEQFLPKLRLISEEVSRKFAIRMSDKRPGVQAAEALQGLQRLLEMPGESLSLPRTE